MQNSILRCRVYSKHFRFPVLAPYVRQLPSGMCSLCQHNFAPAPGNLQDNARLGRLSAVPSSPIPSHVNHRFLWHKLHFPAAPVGDFIAGEIIYPGGARDTAVRIRIRTLSHLQRRQR
jgi:hypothetical protein